MAGALGVEAVYAATKGPRDEDCEGGHRHLVHSVMFSVLLGAAVGAGVLAWSGSRHWALLAGGGIALGCVTHIVGDALTLSGVSGFLWPIPIAGETFYEVRTPRWMRFRTGVSPRSCSSPRRCWWPRSCSHRACGGWPRR